MHDSHLFTVTNTVTGNDSEHDGDDLAGFTSGDDTPAASDAACEAVADEVGAGVDVGMLGDDEVDSASANALISTAIARRAFAIACQR